MDDDNQIEVPPSFMALYTARGGHRLTEPIAHVRARYELCEDTAQTLAEAAAAAQFRSGGTPGEVLQGMQHALGDGSSSVQPPEAAWIVTRIAELLNWAPPGDA